MALARLVYRDQLFPRHAYRRAFDTLLEQLGERRACRDTVALLAIAHEHACEAQLAAALDAVLDAGELPDLARLRARFTAPQGGVPEVDVHLPALSGYDALLAHSGADLGDAR